MTDYPVEPNVPLPRDRRGTTTRYPWKSLDVGDSFFVPCPEGRTLKAHRNNLVRLAWHYGRTHGGEKFSTRVQDGGVRVWRIE